MASTDGRNKGGRPKGSLNKVTRAFKDLTLAVIDRMGGEDAYLAWAQKNPNLFYGGICKSLIPHEAHHSGEIRLPVSVVDELHET